MQKERVRGSELLKQRWSEADLVRLADVERDGVELVEIFPRGIPAPDGWTGTFHVHPDALANLLKHLTEGPLIPQFWVGPVGTPWPDLFKVGVAAGSAGDVTR